MRAEAGVVTGLVVLAALLGVTYSITSFLSGFPTQPVTMAAVEITNCTELQNMKNNLTGDYVLANDIDCDVTPYNTGSGFVPVGNSSNTFTGSLDGQNHTITGLYINSTTGYIGLLGYADAGSEIKNISLEDVNITANGPNVGGLAGYGAGTITDSHVTGSLRIIALQNNLGCLAGVWTGTINRSYGHCDLDSSGNYAGGLVGNPTGSIENSYARGNVSSNNVAGGIGGICGGTIRNSYAAMDDIASAYNLGGLCGLNQGADIYYSFSSSNISGTQPKGGLLGQFNSGTLTECYWNNHTGNPDNCTWTAGKENPSGCNAITNNKSYFYYSSNAPMSSWDFTNVWQENTDDYPTLGVSEEPPSLSCGDTITTSTTLTGNLTGCSTIGLSLGADNIVLDCDNYYIIGDGSNDALDWGINVSGKHNVTVRNCRITAFRYGVRTYDSDYSTWENNIIYNNFLNGMTIDTSINNTISENTIENHGNDAIYINYGNNHTIEKNTIINITSGFGIRLDTTSYNIVDGNELTDVKDAMYLYDSSQCFLPGTKILLSDGSQKDIEDIVTGDRVSSYDILTGTLIPSRVVKTFYHERSGGYLIINGVLKVTPNHPMYVNGEWKEAGEIEAGDLLLDREGNEVPVTSTERVDETVPVYNLEVAPQNSDGQCGPNHNYFADGVLVHNKCPRIFTNNGTGYEFDTLINVMQVGEENDKLFSYPLKHLAEPEIRVDYDPEEINYIDFIKLVVTDTPEEGPNRTYTLNPVSCDASEDCLSLLEKRDGEYMLSDENYPQFFVTFEPLPEPEPGYDRQIEIHSSGYQIMLGELPDPPFVQEFLEEYISSKGYREHNSYNVVKNNIINCSIIPSPGNGFDVFYEDYVTVFNNTVMFCSYGIIFNQAAQWSNVTGNTFKNNTRDGIYVSSDSTGNTFTDNVACFNNQSTSGNYYDIRDADSATFYNNTCDTQSGTFCNNSCTVSVPPLSVSCGDTVSTSGKLGANLTGCSGNGLTINTSGVTLDCDGYAITGDNTGVDYGVYIGNSLTGVTVKNCNIYNFSQGFGIYSASSGAIESNTITNCKWGIVGDSDVTSFSGRITKNYITGSTQAGITSYATGLTNITNNTLTSNNYGLYIGYLQSVNKVWHNNVYSNTKNIYSIYTPFEASYNNEGNYWGRTSCPLFIPGTDSNNVNVTDSYPYNASNAWLTGGVPDNCKPDCGETITASATLTENLAGSGTCLNIGADDVVLDCDGHTITYGTGGGNSAFGVRIYGRDNITVKNCIIQKTSSSGNEGFGIYLLGHSNNSVIYNNTISTNGVNSNHGIRLYQATYNDILSNTISTGGTSSNVGIDCNYCSYNLIDSNNISTSGPSGANYGLLIGYGYGSGISSNNVTNNNITTSGASSSRGVWFAYTSWSSRLVNNIISDCSGEGIFLSDSDSNTFIDNTIVYSDGSGILIGASSTGNTFNNTHACFNNQSGGAYSYDINDQDASTFTNNTCDTQNGTTCHNPCTTTLACGDTITTSKTLTGNLTGCSGNGLNIGADGITLDCNGYYIIGSGPGDDYYGVNVTGRNNVVVQNCNIQSFGTQALVQNSNNVKLLDNTMETGYYYGGIRVVSSLYTDISSNSVTSVMDGIVLSNANHSYLYDNTISSTNYYGISVTSSRNNTLTQNTISSTGDNQVIVQNSADINFLQQENVASYAFTNAGLIFDNDEDAKLRFLNSITQSGTNLSHDIQIGYNLIEVDSSKTGFNTSANLTFYSTPVFSNRHPYRNGEACPTSICTELVDADEYVFNVTHFTNYSVGEGPLTCGGTVATSKTLTESLTGCTGVGLHIGADNIVLDCDNYHITGDGNKDAHDYGINITGRNNVTVKNCTISNFESAIHFDNTSDITVVNNTVENNHDGFHFYGGYSYGNNLTDNTVNNNSYHGFAVMMTKDSFFINNRITNTTSGTGFYLAYDSDNNTIVSIITTNNYGHGIEIGMADSTSNTFTDTYACFNNQSGGATYYDIKDEDANTFYNNTCDTNSNTFCNNSCTAVLACGDTIYSNTTLTADLANCSGDGLVIGVDDVTLDCQGHNITGNGTGSGIKISNKHRTAIKNCRIYNFNDGIYLLGGNSNLTNNTVNYNSDSGVYLAAYSSNILENNTANHNSNYGVYLSNAMNNNLTNNTANDNGQHGIYLFETSNGNRLASNTANNNTYDGINILDSDNNVLTSNTAINNSRNGVFLSSSSNNNNLNNTRACFNNEVGGYYDINDLDANTFYNNTCDTSNNTFCNNSCTPPVGCGTITTSTTLTDNLLGPGTCLTIGADDVILDCDGYTITYGTGGGNSVYGINITRRDNVTVKNCIIQKTSGGGSEGYGISLQYSNNSVIYNNTVSTNGAGNGHGIHVYQALYNDILSNTVHTTGTGGRGVNCEFCSYNVIDSNNISTSGSTNSIYGMRVAQGYGYGTGSNNITNNIITTSGTTDNNGIDIYYIWDNRFVNNTISNCDGHGIYADTESVNNTFIDNKITYSDWSGVHIQSTGNTFTNTYACDNNQVSGTYFDINDLDANTFYNNTCNTNNNTFCNNSCPFILTCGATLTQSYTMTSDLTGCTVEGIIIGADDIVLNCDGHAIQGDGSKDYYDYGINITSRNNITIKNCRVSNFHEGIYYKNGFSNSTILNNTVENCDSGFNGWGAHSYSNNVTDNTVNDINGYAFSVMLMNDSFFMNNRVNNASSNGFSVSYDSYNNTFFSTTVTNSSQSGVEIDSYSMLNTFTDTYSCFNNQSTSGNYYDIRDYDSSTFYNNTCDTNYNTFCNNSCTAALSCGDTIYSDTTLTADLTGCTGDGLIIGANDTVLDCAGHTIDGVHSGDYKGVKAEYKNNVTIKNCTITGFGTGIMLYHSTSNTIDGINSTDNMVTGILLWSSSNNSLTNSITPINGNYGIYFYSNSNNNTLTNITSSGTTAGYGIYIYSSSNNTLTNVNSSSCSAHGIYFTSSSKNNTLTNINSSHNGYDGISISADSTNNTFTDTRACFNNQSTSGGPYYDINDADANTFYNNTCDTNYNTFCNNSCTAALPCGDTIYSDTTLTADLTGCTGNILVIGANNVVLNCDGHELSGTGGAGVLISGKNNVTVKNCNIYNVNRGIHVENSKNSTLTNNTVINTSEGYGIYIYWGVENARLISNTANNNTAHGIYLDGSFGQPINITLINNTANYNGERGIYISSSSNNTLKNNTVNYNNWSGIRITSDSTGNNFSNTYACFNNQSGGATYYDIKDEDANTFYNNTCDTNSNTFCNNSCTAAVCGNGAVEGAEECDDGNTDNGDCCNSTCYISVSDNPANDGDCKACNASGSLVSDDSDTVIAATGCGYCSSGTVSHYTSGEHNCLECQTCTGATSTSCVYISDNTWDTEGSSTCDSAQGPCAACQSGTCSYADEWTDPGSQCEEAECGTGYCSGLDEHNCGHYSTGKGACEMCKTCEGASDEYCLDIDGEQDSEGGCDSQCQWCRSGSCDYVDESGEDPGDLCDVYDCATGYCKSDGSGECDYYTSGKGLCDTCMTCEDAGSESCEEISWGEQDPGYCDYSSHGPCAWCTYGYCDYAEAGYDPGDDCPSTPGELDYCSGEDYTCEPIPGACGDGVKACVCGDTLVTDYTMTSDLTGCTGNGLNMGADDITLDCAGHTVTYGTSGGSYKGINITKRDNVTVKNCIIYKTTSTGAGSHGIELHHSNHSVIYNNTINTNGTYDNMGIRCDFCSYNVIDSNNVSTGGLGDGIYIGYGYGTGTGSNNITNNIITAAGGVDDAGIRTYYTWNNRFVNNTISNCTENGIYLDDSSNNNIFVDNEITYSDWNGIYVKLGSYDNTFTNTYTCFNNQAGGYYDINNLDANIFTNNTCNNAINTTCHNYCAPPTCGDVLTQSYTMTSDLTGCAVEGLTLGADNVVLDCAGHSIGGDYSGTADEDRGVFATDRNNLTVKNCNIYGFYSAGIYFSYGGNHHILNNVIYDIDNNGISHTFGNGSAITGNTVRNSGTGFFIESSSGSSISSNTANNNTYNGIRLIINSDGNTFTSNTLDYNNRNGIYIDSTSTDNNFTNTGACFNNQTGGDYYDIYDLDNNTFSSSTCDTNYSASGFAPCDSPCPYCGDGACDPDETCSTCPEDCGVCPPEEEPAPSGGRAPSVGGGLPSNISEARLSQTFALISPSTPLEMIINKTQLDLTEIFVDVNRELAGARMVVEQFASKPADIPDPPGHVYAYLSITVTNLPSDAIDSALLRLRVNKTWITENNINKTTITLYRHVADWEGLPTVFDRETDDYVYYTTSAPGFSNFVITGERIAVAPPLCTEGEKQCVGNELQTCSNETWTVLEVCEFGCDPDTLTCKEAPWREEAPAPPAPFVMSDYYIVYGFMGVIFLIIVGGAVYVARGPKRRAARKAKPEKAHKPAKKPKKAKKPKSRPKRKKRAKKRR